MDFNELSDGLKKKAKECKTPEEFIALAKEEGLELTDAELEAISGGKWCIGVTCAEACWDNWM